MSITKKVSFMMMTDTHLHENNIELVVGIFKQAFDTATQHNLNTIYHLGDWFTSRKAQPLSVLKATVRILSLAEKELIKIIIIPGNHDKADTTQEASYLDIFKRYHDVLSVISKGTYILDVSAYIGMFLVPYFLEGEHYDEQLENALDDYHEMWSDQDPNEVPEKDYLLTHIAISGVMNNDGSEINNTLDEKRLDTFTKVFVGHYHNKQQINVNTFYIGSTHQSNFGEDDQKGFTLVYEDGTHELVQSDFPRYNNVKIDLDTITEKEYIALIEENSDTEENVKFKIVGDKSKIVSLDKKKLDKAGITYDCKQKDVDVDLSYIEATEFTGFDNKTLKDEWKVFSEKKEIGESQNEYITNLLEELL